jgi:hypothetical protein
VVNIADEFNADIDNLQSIPMFLSGATRPVDKTEHREASQTICWDSLKVVRYVI